VLGFSPLSGGPLSTLFPPAAAVPGVFMRGLGTVGCATGCGCAPSGCCFLVCAPCAIPEKDLTISWVNPIEGNGSDTLVYSGSGTWTTGCSGGAGIGNQLIFTYGCNGGNTELRVYYFISGSCPTGQTNYCSNLRSSGFQLVEGSAVCSPYSVPFTLTSGTCPVLAASGFTGFTVSDPSPVAAPVMCQHFCASQCSTGVSGVTISVYASMGGTLLASGTTLSAGCVNLSWTGTPGTYYVTATATGYTSYGASLVLACGGSMTIGLAYSVSDPYCCGPCYLSVSSSTLTDLNGTYTLTEGTDSQGTYFRCNTTASVSNLITVIPGVPATCTINTGNALVYYICRCSHNPTTGIYSFTVTRNWLGQLCHSGVLDSTCTQTSTWCYSAGTLVQCFIGQSSASLVSPGGITCSPFTWSSALALIGSPPLGDPVGGTVVVEI
jgi:hypothetical protein